MKKIIVISLSIIVLLAVIASWSNVSASRMEDEVLFETVPVSDEASIAPITGTSIDTANQDNNPIPNNIEALPTDQDVDLTASLQESALQTPNLDLQTSVMNQNGNGRGRRQAGQLSSDGVGNSSTAQESITLSGTVSSFLAPQLALSVDGEQIVSVQVPNLYATDGSALALTPGEQVSATGYYNASGLFYANQITLIATDQTFTARNQGGRPEWAGQGQNNK